MSTSVSCPCDRYYDGSCVAVDACECQTVTISTTEVTTSVAHAKYTGRAVIGGAVSMALGEYVSVSSQRDSERTMGMSQLVNPWSTAVASFISFILGAALPFAAALFAPVAVIFGVTLIALTLTGAPSAHLSNVPKTRAILRIVIGGMLALAVTFAVGSIFGAAI